MEQDYQPSNREKAMQPGRGRFWCSCDVNIVGDGDRCSICKQRPNRKKRRGTIPGGLKREYDE